MRMGLTCLSFIVECIKNDPYRVADSPCHAFSDFPPAERDY